MDLWVHVEVIPPYIHSEYLTLPWTKYPISWERSTIYWSGNNTWYCNCFRNIINSAPQYCNWSKIELPHLIVTASVSYWGTIQLQYQLSSCIWLWKLPSANPGTVTRCRVQYQVPPLGIWYCLLAFSVPYPAFGEVLSKLTMVRYQTHMVPVTVAALIVQFCHFHA